MRLRERLSIITMNLTMTLAGIGEKPVFLSLAYVILFSVIMQQDLKEPNY